MNSGTSSVVHAIFRCLWIASTSAAILLSSCRELTKDIDSQNINEIASDSTGDHDVNLNVRVQLTVGGQISNLTLDGETFNLNASAAQAGAFQVTPVDIARAGGSTATTMDIDGSEIGADIAIIAKTPLNFSSLPSSLELGLTDSSASLGLIDSVSDLTGFIVAKPRVAASSNGTAEIDLAGTLSMKLLRASSGSPISPEIKREDYDDLKTEIAVVQRSIENDVSAVDLAVAEFLPAVFTALSGAVIKESKTSERFKELITKADSKAGEKFDANIKDLKLLVAKQSATYADALKKVLSADSDYLQVVDEIYDEVRSDSTFELPSGYSREPLSSEASGTSANSESSSATSTTTGSGSGTATSSGSASGSGSATNSGSASGSGSATSSGTASGSGSATGSGASTSSGNGSGDGDGDGDGSGDNAIACAAGHYDVDGSCVEVGMGYWSPADNGTRTACSNAPAAHATYTSPTAGSATCAFACDAGYIYNSSSEDCESLPNADPFLCASNQVMVGIHGRSGGWLDRLGVRCATVVGGAITGTPEDGALNGTSNGGSPFVVDCPAGEAVVRVSGDNFSGYTGRIAIQCATFPGGVTSSLSSYQGGATSSPFDFECPEGQFKYGMVLDTANNYTGPTLGTYCR